MLVFIYIVFGAYASFYIMFRFYSFVSEILPCVSQPKQKKKKDILPCFLIMFWFYLFVYDILPLSNIYMYVCMSCALRVLHKLTRFPDE